MSKKQTTQTATANNTTDAKETAKKEAKLPTVEGMFSKAEKQYNEAIGFVMLPNSAEALLKFKQTTSKYVRGETPQDDHVEKEEVTQEVRVTGEQINATVNQKYGMSKEQLITTINNVDKSKLHLVGLVTIRAKNSIKRAYNPFAL